MQVSRPAIAGIAAVVVVLGALLVLVLQPGGGEDGPLNTIAAAAERTQEEPGARAAMRALVTSPERSEPFTISGEIVFNDETERSHGVLAFTNPESGEPVEMETVTDGLIMYMSSETFGSLPDESEWMKLDLSAATGMEASVPSVGDAQRELDLLAEVTGGIRKLGKESVRGVPTTHYRGTIDASRNAERLREEGQDDLAAVAEEDPRPITAEVWIDADGLVRRMRYTQSPPGEGREGSSMDMRMDFYDFGIVPEIDVPEESEVFDATGLAEEALDQASE